LSSDLVQPRDAERVATLIGRTPSAEFVVVVRRTDGDPVVIRNAPLLADGTPMPTRYWLVGERENVLVGRLESSGGVARAESTLDPSVIADAHARYAVERDAAMPAGHIGPRPSGGVAGTRRGVKCLHAHLAWWLAGGDDPVGAWTAGEIGLDRGDYRRGVSAVAAIDIGTNSTNLLVSGDGEPLRVVTTTRLGRDASPDGTLGEEGIATTLERLAEYRRTADAAGAPIVAVATAVCRHAPNAERFLDRAESVLGVRPRVLSTEQEGRLAWHGALVGLDEAEGPTLVVDIGGGSTELVLGTSEPSLVLSIDAGAVTLTRDEFTADPPRPEELTNAIGRVALELEDLVRQHPELRTASRVVGVAGTVVTVAAVEIGLREFDARRLHGFVLTRDAAEDVFRTLATEALADRVHNPGLPADRADVAVGGCCALVAVMRTLRLDSMTVSVHNLLDALAAGMAP
jgi:exopolyphosphatase/guanosine-5'-triphosphate,3'-diphosphate pyrophosphatase